jgi:glycosyltransferase involved in cell wall biosynthesis
LACRSNEDDFVLCFGNLPPLFRIKGDISVFLQNRYLVDKLRYLLKLPMRSALRLFLERIWLHFLKDRAGRYFVQTATMRVLVQEHLGLDAVEAPLLPCSLTNRLNSIVNHSNPKFDFLYVASGEMHKNHKILVAAWSMLAAEGIFPSLALTLKADTNSELIQHINNECVLYGLRIHNLGLLPHEKIIKLYQECGAFIYPSYFESFGLPLIEAQIAGLAILAPELDYVRDIIEPQETFDPRSKISIVRAIKRYIKAATTPLQPINADVFLSKLMRSE